MAWDVLVRGGTVVDGTGASARTADVGVVDGRIAAIGRLDTAARRTIDADGCVVAPGFIDPHTHYDAQICWDPLLTPSSWHGVTTVVAGNCGVGLAPCRPEAREIATRDLVNVESIAYEVLEQGIEWEWESFAQYLDAADARRPALNLAWLAPLTPFRHFVMGEDSMARAANADETERIAALVGQALDAGAFGLSTTIMAQHMGYGGQPLACRRASTQELCRYAAELARRDRGIVQIALTRQLGVLDEEEAQLLETLLDAAQRPVTFIALFDRDDKPEASREVLARIAPMAARGVRPQVSPLPLTREIDLRKPFSFAAFPAFKRVFADLSPAALRATYADPAFRAQFRHDLLRPANFGNWERIALHEACNPALQPLEGRSIAELARQANREPVDTFLDLALQDELRALFTMVSFNTRVDRMTELLNRPEILVGLGDAGAHLDMLCDAGYPTYLLGTWVRERGALSMERAVAMLTSEPADAFGLHGRGRLAPGLAADITVFDPARVGSAPRTERLHDLPSGAKRMVMRSQGIACTLVAGVPVWSSGHTTGERPGRVLRSGHARP